MCLLPQGALLVELGRWMRTQLGLQRSQALRADDGNATRTRGGIVGSGCCLTTDIPLHTGEHHIKPSCSLRFAHAGIDCSHDP